ncbi:long-chain-alcohol oxidase, partial [Sarracenia purpurea var. burkii]
MERSCHPLLKGGRRENQYSHGFSTAEMESLASLCETFLPPLPLNSLQVTGKDAQTNKAIQFFHKVSASDDSTPQEVAEAIVERGFSEGVIMARVILL